MVTGVEVEGIEEGPVGPPMVEVEALTTVVAGPATAVDDGGAVGAVVLDPPPLHALRANKTASAAATTAPRVGAAIADRPSLETGDRRVRATAVVVGLPGGGIYRLKYWAAVSLPWTERADSDGSPRVALVEADLTLTWVVSSVEVTSTAVAFVHTKLPSAWSRVV